MLNDDFQRIENVEDLKELIEYHLFMANEIRVFAKNNDCLNEQFYINWEDELNRFSTMDPNN